MGFDKLVRRLIVGFAQIAERLHGVDPKQDGLLFARSVVVRFDAREHLEELSDGACSLSLALVGNTVNRDHGDSL